jgi:formylglycine-generating enzyme required for sulfatase activity
VVLPEAVVQRLAHLLDEPRSAFGAGVEALCAHWPELAAWAERIAVLTQAHPGAVCSWAEARAALAKADGIVASELYRGQVLPLRDQDVVGLVPIGMNPATKLWEFYELRSAWDGSRDPATLEIPRHVRNGTDEGHIRVGDDPGIVFVLLPGGSFTMGAQRADGRAPNFDASARDDETPHRVTLSPFFLARHEMTQGQWKRLTGQEPSQYRAGTLVDRQNLTWASPVEQIDWFSCERWLPRYGMALPTEAQWEYGCRAGTSTPWWTGAERDSLRGAVNLPDHTAAMAGVTWSDIADWPDLEDGFVVQAPVDTLRPNPFGLHPVHGNVFEWCADWYSATYTPLAAGATRRVSRGGCCGQAASFARSAFRGRNAPVAQLPFYGVRPARALHVGD